MALHPEFPVSPYAPLIPSQRWFPADETLRATSYAKLLPPLGAKIREHVHTWRVDIRIVCGRGSSPVAADAARTFKPHHLAPLVQLLQEAKAM